MVQLVEQAARREQRGTGREARLGTGTGGGVERAVQPALGHDVHVVWHELVWAARAAHCAARHAHQRRRRQYVEHAPAQYTVHSLLVPSHRTQLYEFIY